MTEVEQILAWRNSGPVESEKQALLAYTRKIVVNAERLEHEKPTSKVPLFSMHARHYDGSRTMVMFQAVTVKIEAKSRWANSRYQRLFDKMDENKGNASDINWGQHG